MAKEWLLIIFALALNGVNANELSDFSNNLATDIGPLLVLFGESMTRQYLSESTRFRDYFIFAMAPIGIITAMVSAIRVCGHPSLRAFVGRSQEGDGVVEAELCTSTSRDVCELFNKGGITRLLGRPRILELVYVPGPKAQDPSFAADRAGLFLFRHYLEAHRDQDTCEWTRMSDNASLSFAPKPNLSLNVGIKTWPDWVFYVVASVGFVLQAGVLALAGIGVWVLQWNLNKASTPASGNYAPIMFITGTLLMCVGVWACAALIGETTHELRYERKCESEQNSRLLWLQPGPQKIGDQSFDPFAYFDKEDNPLRRWTSSTKDFDEKFEVYTLFAVSAVLVGYIVQFIGLRGMKAWVSIAQLGITVVMSILRGLLRTQRLGRRDNKLAEMPDLVGGHELDWLSFNIAQMKHFMPIHELHDQAQKQTRTQDNSSTNSSKRPSSLAQKEARCDNKPTLAVLNSTQTLATSVKALDSGVNSRALLQIRVRLSHLTGYSSFSNIKDSECQYWEDEYVKVRGNARKLSAALSRASESLRLPKRDTTLRIELGDTVTHGIALMPPPPQSAQASWRIDSAKLEAILGLWMWSLLSDKDIEMEDDVGNRISLAEKIKAARIVSAGIDDRSWHNRANRQGEMSLWFGPNAVALSEVILTADKHDKYGLIDLWAPAHNESDRNNLATEQVSDQSKPSEPLKLRRYPQPMQWKTSRLPRNLRRFCGWDPVHQTLQSGARDSTSAANAPTPPLARPVELRVQWIPTNHSLLDICTQDLFIALMTSLISHISVGETTVVESAGNVQLDNPTVASLAGAFTENHLGSHFDALSCIIPAFGKQLRPNTEVMLQGLIRAADIYRQNAEWERAETLLRWACQHYSLPHDGGELNKVPGDDDFVVRALRATGELYRWSLVHRSNDERRRFGMSGVKWMVENYHNASNRSQEIKENLARYRTIAERIDKHTAGPDLPQDAARIQQQLVKAIQDRDRTEALYLLCFITAGGYGASDSQPALPLAARNNWSEVVSVILEMKANPDNQDEDGRTAISHCAELGYELYLKPLIDRGALLDRSENGQRTPLFWAAENGHANIAKLLLNTGYVDTNRSDVNGQTPLWLAARSGHAAVVQLLLEKGADVESKDKEHGQTPLWLASWMGHEAVVKQLLEKGANIESKNNEHGQTPLWLAAWMGHEVVVQQLLEKGADVESKDKEHGQAPLSRAARSGHEAVVRQLLEKGADIESKDKRFSRTPLCWAAKNGHEAVVRRLLEKGADIESSNEENNRTPLSWAAESGHEAVVGRLLEQGADIESKDEKFSQTPLCWAAKNGHEAVIQRLLEKGANFELKDIYSRTPLWLAAKNGNEAAVQQLLEKGADVESKSLHSETPLSQAAESGHGVVVRRLIEKGADLESRDRYSRTPLLLAGESGHEAVVQQLLEKGADVESRDNYGRTPRSEATERGNSAITKLIESKV